MSTLRKYLLTPFSGIYGLGVRLRNWLFDRHIRHEQTFTIPTIGIGNLAAGGTGKTPMTEYVVRLFLESGFKPAVLSRGYGRDTHGYHVVKRFSSAKHVGDEPYQVKRKFPEAVVIVCEDRAEGINRLRNDFPETNVIILDDSFQHRGVKTGITILLTEFHRPYFLDSLLPAGMLREPISGRTRADIIIMTKCPEIPVGDRRSSLTKKLMPFQHQKVFFTCIDYKYIVHVDATTHQENEYPVNYLKGYQIMLFTGIANPKPIEDYLSSKGISFKALKFSDHHKYTSEEIENILMKFESMPEMNKMLLTTEKDWRRIENTPEEKLLSGIPFYYLPIGVSWDPADKAGFDKILLEYVDSAQPAQRQ